MITRQADQAGNNMPTIYSKRFLFYIRIFSFIAIILLVIRTGSRLADQIKEPEYFRNLPLMENIRFQTTILKNIGSVIISIWLFFHPQEFHLIGIIAFIHSINLSPYGVSDYFFIPMRFLSIATFTVRGFFKKNKVLKISLFSALYIIELLIPLAYHDEYFFFNFLTRIAFSFVLFMTIFFFYRYATQIASKQNVKDKVLNIANFKGLDRSDMYLLQQVLDNVKYKEIAQKIHGSEGALRNKLSKIYKVLEVGDRTGFLTIYSGYELIYEPENVEQTTDQP